MAGMQSGAQRNPMPDPRGYHLVKPSLETSSSDHSARSWPHDAFASSAIVAADAGHLSPGDPDALIKRGVALCDLGKFDNAIDLFTRAHRLQPNLAEPLFNIGMSQFLMGKTDEAIVHYERALELRSDYPELRRNLGYALLCRGDYDRGWQEHEWRLKCDQYIDSGINRTFWTGDDLAGRRILLHAEQGFGDALQFIRFVPQVKARGGQVVVRCATRLLRVIARCAGVDMAVDGSSYEPPCDIDAPLMSLPALFRTTLDTLPARVPYLAIDRAHVDHWRNELAQAIAADHAAHPADHGPAEAGGPARPFLIGIAWQGNPAQRTDQWRSFPLAQLVPLAALPRVRLVNLQTDHGLDQVAPLAGRMSLIELTGRRGRDFMETAAILSHLDLVITADTAIAHLAGGLGLRVWVARCAIGDWRWLHGRDDSPWYPTMRLFRQTTLGDWDGVFQRMAQELERELGDKSFS